MQGTKNQYLNEQTPIIIDIILRISIAERISGPGWRGWFRTPHVHRHEDEFGLVHAKRKQ